MDRVQEIKDKIDNLFADTSVSREQTKEDLGDIISHCEIMVNAIDEDIKREQGA